MRAALLVLGALLPFQAAAELSDAEALALHQDALVVDTHADTTTRLLDPEWRFDERHDHGHVDLPRIAEGGLDAVFLSIYLGRTEGEGRAIRGALERIDAVHETVRRHRGRVAFADTASELRRIGSDGRLAVLMGLEGGHLIENSLAALRIYHRLGVRYVTLTHSFHTEWADSSGTNEAPEPRHGGLTAFGREVVREMNRLGMMVDVSHVSDATVRDVLETTRAPVLASHSSCRAIADHPRNLPDDLLRAIAANGGVVQINFYSGYIDPALVGPTRAHRESLRPHVEMLRERFAADPVARARAVRELLREHPYPQTTLDVLLDHFDHAIRVAGPDHVGIGSDWDGVPSMPAGMDDVSRLPALTRGLLRRGHTPETVRKVLGGNLLRVMAETERAAGR